MKSGLSLRLNVLNHNEGSVMPQVNNKLPRDLGTNLYLTESYKQDKNCDEQIQQFNQLSKTLSKIYGMMTDIPRTEKLHKEEALAFLIEAIKQMPQDSEDPDLWKKTIKQLNDRIVEMSQNKSREEALAEVSWMISQLVDNLYQKTLARHAVDGDLDKKKEYARCLRTTHTFESFQKKLHEQNKAVSFGAIVDDFIPDWYKNRRQDDSLGRTW